MLCAVSRKIEPDSRGLDPGILSLAAKEDGRVAPGHDEI